QDLIQGFQDVMNEGEYYQGQLQQKIRLILPNFVNNDSSIEIEKLSLVAPHGKITAHGEIKWPENNFDMLVDVHDLLMITNLTLDVRISKKLEADLVQFVATMPDSIRDVASP